MGPKTCIGTYGDTQVDSPEVSVTDEDRDFILANANALLDLDSAIDPRQYHCGTRRRTPWLSAAAAGWPIGWPVAQARDRSG